MTTLIRAERLWKIIFLFFLKLINDKAEFPKTPNECYNDDV